MRKKIAILASGSGTNAENLIQYFKNSEEVSIELILSNKSDAYVLQRAKKHHVKSFVFSKNDFNNETGLLKILQNHDIDYVILAGFLLLVPLHIIKYYPNKIINIHPALLPKYGGKGMYGNHVHKTVVENKEIESGITIHLVNEKFDDGKILFQQKCEVNSLDTADSLAAKIHTLEYAYFPEVVENYILKR